MLFLKANPDPYGRFGHQTCNILAAYLLSKIAGVDFYPERYKFVSKAFNKIIDWKRITYRHDQLFSYRHHLEDTLPIHLEQLTISSSITLKHYLEAIKLTEEKADAKENILLELPFGLMTGILDNILHFHLGELRKIYISRSTIATKRISIHLRRGDASQANRLLVSEELQQQKILDIINNRVPADIPVHILTQENDPFKLRYITDGIDHKRLTMHLETGDFLNNSTEIEHFNFMANSEYLITGKSAFSRLAGLLGSCKYVYEIADSDTNTKNSRALGIQII
jgi:hypothetical protein